MNTGLWKMGSGLAASGIAPERHDFPILCALSYSMA
jgi:hypothetical protein